MKLAELKAIVAKLDGEASFAVRFPEPALVFLVPFTPGATEGATIRIQTDAHTNLSPKSLLGRTTEGPAARRGYKLDDESEVTFLKKTDRNPFANMVTVGRAQNNDVWIPVPSVSKLHAYFSLSGPAWYLTDQNAVNGTLVDGEAIGSAPIADGAEISFGPDVRVRFFGPAALFRFIKALR